MKRMLDFGTNARYGLLGLFIDPAAFVIPNVPVTVNVWFSSRFSVP